MQDVIVLLSEGRSHFIFNLPIFQTTAFKTFQQELLLHIGELNYNRNTNMDAGFPEIQSLLQNVHYDIKET